MTDSRQCPLCKRPLEEEPVKQITTDELIAMDDACRDGMLRRISYTMAYNCCWGEVESFSGSVQKFEVIGLENGNR